MNIEARTYDESNRPAESSADSSETPLVIPFGNLGYISEDGSINPTKSVYTLSEAQMMTGYPKEAFVDLLKKKIFLLSSERVILMMKEQSAIELRLVELDLSAEHKEPIWAVTRVLGALRNDMDKFNEAIYGNSPIINDGNSFYKASDIKDVFSWLKDFYPKNTYIDFVTDQEPIQTPVLNSESDIPKIDRSNWISQADLFRKLGMSRITFHNRHLDEIAKGERIGLFKKYSPEDEARIIRAAAEYRPIGKSPKEKKVEPDKMPDASF